MTQVDRKLAEEPAADVEPAAVLLVEMDGCELRTGTIGEPHPTERTPARGLPRRKRSTDGRDVRLACCRDLYDDQDKHFVGGMSPFPLLDAATSATPTAELAAALGVSPRTLQNDLSTLESFCLAHRTGRGRAIRWSR